MFNFYAPADPLASPPAPRILIGESSGGSLRPVSVHGNDGLVPVPPCFERRIEVDQIDRLIGDVSPQNVEIIAVVQRVHARRVRLRLRRCCRLRTGADRLLGHAIEDTSQRPEWTTTRCALLGVEERDHEQVGRLLLRGDAQPPGLLGQPRLGHRHAVLREHLRLVEVGAPGMNELEGDGDARLAVESCSRRQLEGVREAG